MTRFASPSESEEIRLYDSYIRAYRWASSRIKNQGVIAFVSNGSIIDKGFADGFRKTLAREFSAVYAFNLRGDAHTSGEQRRKEKDSVFGQGSRAPIAIMLLVKNPKAHGPFKLRYHDIGDYLTQEQKLGVIETFGSIDSVPWQAITPNESGDWINQRDETFASYRHLGARGTQPQARCSAYTPSASLLTATPGLTTTLTRQSGRTCRG